MKEIPNSPILNAAWKAFQEETNPGNLASIVSIETMRIGFICGFATLFAEMVQKVASTKGPEEFSVYMHCVREELVNAKEFFSANEHNINVEKPDKQSW